MSSTSQSQPLAERSPNTSPKKPTAQSDWKPQDKVDMKEKSAVAGLQQEQKQGAHAYISPSDTIMSPTTKKLEAIRGKRFANAKPQSLFAKTVSRQGLARSGGGGGLDGEK